MTNSPEDGIEDEIKVGLAALWARSRPNTIRRAQAVADAVEQLASGETAGGHAEVLAHKLAGSLGTFGLNEASALAKSIERELQQPSPSPDALRALANALCESISLHDS